MIRTVILLVLFSASAFAQEAPDPRVLVFASSYSPPYTTDSQTGILDLVLKEAARRIGYEARIVRAPAERCLRDANAGVFDGDVARTERIAALYPNLRMVPETIIPGRDFVAFTCGSDTDISRWQHLSGKNVGSVRGWKIFDNNVPDAARSHTRVDTTRQLFEMLAKKRIDVALSARLDGLAMANSLGIDCVRDHDHAFASLMMYPYLNKTHEDIIQPFAEALAAMKQDGAFLAIHDRVVAEWVTR